MGILSSCRNLRPRNARGSTELYDRYVVGPCCCRELYGQTKVVEVAIRQVSTRPCNFADVLPVGLYSADGPTGFCLRFNRSEPSWDLHLDRVGCCTRAAVRDSDKHLSVTASCRGRAVKLNRCVCTGCASNA